MIIDLIRMFMVELEWWIIESLESFNDDLEEIEDAVSWSGIVVLYTMLSMMAVMAYLSVSVLRVIAG